MAKLIIQELCKARGLKMADLADKLGVKRSTLSTTLTNGNLRIDSLERIAKALEVEITDLFETSEKANKSAHAINCVCPHCRKQIDISLTIQ